MIKGAAKTIGIILIIVVGFAIYVNSFRNEFIYDDGPLVQKNLFIRDFKYIKDIFQKDIYYFADPGRDNTTGKSNFYRPILNLSFMLDYRFWELRPLGYHLTNTVLHILCALLVCVLVSLVAKDFRIALITSLLFVAHPVHVEAVTYISGRADLLAVFFILSAFCLYVKGSVSKQRVYYVCSLAVFVFALLSKELAAILVPLLILYDFTFDKERRRLGAVINKNKGAYFAYAAAVLAYYLVRNSILRQQHDIPGPGLYIRLITTTRIIMDYFRLLVLPSGLHMERAVHPSKSIFELTTLFSVIALICIGALIRRSYRRSRPLFFSAAWFFIALLPFMNIIPLNAYMAEHWLYLPSIGFFMAVSVGIVRIFDLKRPVLTKLTLLILSAFLIFYSFLTVRQNRVWKDSIIFDEYTLKHSSSLRIHANLGNKYAQEGQLDKAIAEYETALKINPKEFQIYTNLGNIYLDKNQVKKAIENYARALVIYPQDSYAHNNLGVAYMQNGEIDKAISEYKKAIELNPLYADPHTNLAGAYTDKGMLAEARSEWEAVLKINPYDEDAAEKVKENPAIPVRRAQ